MAGGWRSSWNVMATRRGQLPLVRERTRLCRAST